MGTGIAMEMVMGMEDGSDAAYRQHQWRNRVPELLYHIQSLYQPSSSSGWRKSVMRAIGQGGQLLCAMMMMTAKEEGRGRKRCRLEIGVV